jgi:hypothetical protein
MDLYALLNALIFCVKIEKFINVADIKTIDANSATFGKGI